MWTGFAPERIYAEKVTVIELICASPCITTLICMSMEARYRHEASAMDEQVHMARHRFGARGNSLTFPLPWEEILRTLQEHMEEDEAATAVPRSGVELASVVRILLKTNKRGRTTEEDVQSLIHQATVRREARRFKPTKSAAGYFNEMVKVNQNIEHLSTSCCASFCKDPLLVGGGQPHP